MAREQTVFACLCHLGHLCRRCNGEKECCGSHCRSDWDNNCDFIVKVPRFVRLSNLCMCRNVHEWGYFGNPLYKIVVSRQHSRCKGMGNTCPKARVLGNNGKGKTCGECLVTYKREKKGETFFLTPHGRLLKVLKGEHTLARETKEKFLTLKYTHDRMKEMIYLFLASFQRTHGNVSLNVLIRVYFLLQQM